MDDAKDLITCASTSSAHNELLDSSLWDFSKDSGVDYIPNLSDDTKEGNYEIYLLFFYIFLTCNRLLWFSFRSYASYIEKA